MTKPLTITIDLTDINAIATIFHMFFAVCDLVGILPPRGLHADATKLMEKMAKQMEEQAHEDGKKIVDEALKN
jgi:hypothetical protein